jgi:hypothetical protein
MEGMDALGNPMTVIAYENLEMRYVTNTPQRGDCFLCTNIHDNVSVPIAKLSMTHACLRKLAIDDDVLDYYFPLHELCAYFRHKSAATSVIVKTAEDRLKNVKFISHIVTTSLFKKESLTIVK